MKLNFVTRKEVRNTMHQKYKTDFAARVTFFKKIRITGTIVSLEIQNGTILHSPLINSELITLLEKMEVL